MLFKKKLLLGIIVLLCFSNCKNEALHPVSVADFSKFVDETEYITDAEKFDWSIVQEDVHSFNVLWGLSWRCPDGEMEARPEFLVTQVSFIDAAAYAKWANGRLPSYEEFWELTKNDRRPIVESAPEILPLDQVNLIGNVWDITTTERQNGEIRLAGGSYLCNEKTCNGTSPKRQLFVDKMTGNTHISFSIIK